MAKLTGSKRLRWTVRTLGASWIVSRLSATTLRLHLDRPHTLARRQHPCGRRAHPRARGSGHARLAVVAVVAVQPLGLHKIGERALEAVDLGNHHRYVQELVVGVGGAVALCAHHLAAQVAAKDVVDERRLKRAWIDRFPTTTKNAPKWEGTF